MRKHRAILYKIFTGLALMSFFSSCVGFLSNSEASSVNLVERNKASPPSWLQEAPGSLFESEDLLNFYSVENHVRNLPETIKQGEQDVLRGTIQALNVLAKERLMKRLEAERPGVAELIKTSPVLQTRLDGYIGESVQVYHKQYARIADIYFERYSAGVIANDGADTDFFKVYILAQFPSRYLPELIKEVGLHLTSSGDTTLGAAGSLLKRELSKNDQTH